MSLSKCLRLRQGRGADLKRDLLLAMCTAHGAMAQAALRPRQERTGAAPFQTQLHSR